MSTPEFDKFDLDGLSLEEIEPKKVEQPEQTKKVEPKQVELEPEPVQVEEVIEAKPVQPVEADQAELVEKTENANANANVPDGQMVCPKCELLQDKAEQCSGCGVYVKKAAAQIGQSKIQITKTKF